MFGQREGGAAWHHRSASSRRDHEEDQLLAAVERKELAAQKFDEWVRFKDSFDRGLALFAKLNSSHCEGEAWQKVAVSLAAIDRSLGIDLNVALSKTKRPGSTKVKAGPQSMFDAFKKWSMSGHTFKFAKLTVAEIESLGAATQQFLEQEEEGDEAATVLPSLKYNFPPPPARRGLRTRPMTDDQKAMNVIFLRRVRAAWAVANREMREQVAEYVENAETTYQTKRNKALGLKNQALESHGRSAIGGSRGSSVKEGEAKEEGKQGEEKDEKAESKAEENKENEGESKDQRDEGVAGGSGSSDNEAKVLRQADAQEDLQGAAVFRLDSYPYGGVEDERLQARKTRFMDAGLVAVGIRRLNEVLEEDIDRRKKKENDDRLEKEEEARRAHEGWTRVKDTRRFRVPDEEPFRPGGVWKPPRFDFSGGKGLIRPNKNLIASTTLDIMRGQGMKYVHAITDGRQGVEGDLEKSKRQIKRYKEMVGKERKKRTAARQADRAVAFRRWTRLKSITEASVRFLQDIDPPAEAAKRGGWERWLEVGRALKSVDARLLAEWTAWAGGYIPAAHCQAVWDVLPPRSCDTHSNSYSAIRETFLKLLRPGADYREAFHKVVRRRLRRAGARLDDDDDVDDDDLALSRRELRHLLTKELGIVMRGEEMRRLVDAFDTNKDRPVTWQDFEKLTGGVREAVRGDAAKRLERRCVWETTCAVTGMPNAYTVSAVKEAGRAGREVGHGRGDGEEGEHDSRPATAATRASGWVGTSEIITLKSGDRRCRNELGDRTKRLRILVKYGLATPTADNKGDGGGKPEGDYDDDGFEGEDDSYGEDEFERSEGEDRGGRRGSPRRGKGGKESKGGGKVPCEASEWPMSKRTKGLKALKRLSRDNREAGELRQLLADGVAPSPPKFWSAKPGHPDVGEDEDALTEELLLCWRPQPGSAVAFFSLEVSGPVGGKAFRQGTHREICRDPPDADGDPQYQFWVQGLFPNTRYGFRVRAFNGFGPGGYAHGCFATRPARPTAPVAIRAAPTEVSLQWIFGSRTASKLRELRQVFDALDEHDDGEIGREEFLASLDLDYPYLMAMLKASPAATSTDAGGGVWNGGGDGSAAGASGRTTRGGNGGASNAGVGHATLSVFDAIEANDDELVGWEEIELQFAHANTASEADRGGGGVAPMGRVTGGGHFLVEACISQEDDRWKEVWKGSTGTACVKALEPARGYRFRVRAVNCEGQEGAASESMVVNTLLATPSSLRVNGVSAKTTATGVWDTRVRLRWDATGGSSSGAPSMSGTAGCTVAPVRGTGGGVVADRAATKILMEWANDSAEDEGVCVEMAFLQFDRDRSGIVDALELGNLLEALGVEVTEERLREAFTELDLGREAVDGTLSFNDFEAWWTSSATSFALLRDDGVAGNIVEMAAARGVSVKPAPVKSTTVTSFKGRGHGCEVAGLTPNTLYHFRVRAVNNRTRSSLSTPLAVMTAPRRPEPPVIIRPQLRSIVVKWYPGAGGSYKYHLQARLVEGLDGIGAMAEANRTATASGGRRRAWGATGGDGESGWVTVYEGVDSTAKVTGLAANSVYRFRVCSINFRGVASEWSFPAQAATSQRGGGAGDKFVALLSRPQCAAEVFHIDADDDIVVGDTIIFTERLYVDRDGHLIPDLSGAGTGGTAPPPPTSCPSPFHAFPAAASGAVSSAPRVSLSMASLGSDAADGAEDSGGRWAAGTGRGAHARPLATTTATIGGVVQVVSIAAGAAEFVGERTAAAHVLQDSFRSMRRKEEGGVLEYSRAKSRHRMLRMEVIWSTVSRAEADKFVLPRGSIVERSQGRLSQFETFRALWAQDERRKSVREEWSLLSGVS